jgi:plastocyanin
MSSRVRIIRFVPAFLAVLTVAACGGGGTSQGAQPTSGTSASGAGARIAVTETEYSISLPSTSMKPGTYTFAVDNAGTASHDLVIKGPGVDSAKTSQLKRGEKGEVTVTLQAGTYELWCAIANHRAKGMQTTITVG